jgi:hypothetical protein
MATRIRKKKTARHLVVVDRTALHPPDRNSNEVVAPGFEAAWTALESEFDLTLVVPEVVRGEMLYRHSSSAIEAMLSATEHLGVLSKLSDRTYSHKATEEKVRQEVAARFDRWVNRVGARMERTPLDSINWERLIKAAVWREPPFSKADKNSKNEKGFRDALILETARLLCNTEEPTIQIALITNDGDLRKAVEAELKRCQVHASVEGLSTTLRLQQKDLNDEFIFKILTRAGEKFFSEGNEESLYYKERISRKIIEKFPKLFTLAPASGPFSLAETLVPKAPTKAWESVRRRELIDIPQFVSSEGKVYVWQSPVFVVELFRKRALEFYGTGLGSVPFGAIAAPASISWSPAVQAIPSPKVEQRIYLRKFIVKWKATVKDDGRFYSVHLDDIDVALETFGEATDETLSLYALAEGGVS